MSEKDDKQQEGDKAPANGDSANSDTQTSAETEKADKGKALQVPKSRLDEVIKERNALAAKIADAEKAITDAEDAKKLEQGKYKELYEKAQTDATNAANELAGLRSNALRLEVATSEGFPGLWDRITGDSEDELKADLASLVKSFPNAKAANINAGTGSGQRSGEKQQGKMSEDRKQELAALLGVPAAHLPDTPINI